MIDFNLDYLSKQRYHEQRLKALKGYHDANVQNAISLIHTIIRKNQQYCMGISFIRISVSKRVKTQKLMMIQKIISRSLLNCFLRIKRYGILANKSNQIKPENKFNYPLAIINRIYNVNRVSKLQQGWDKFIKYKRYMNIVEMRLIQVQQFCEKYQKRMHMRELFTIFRRVLDRQTESYNHMLTFQKIFEILRVKRLFVGLTQISIKTEMKCIADLQKDKAGKRDESIKSNSKRIEIVNDLKRKTNNMKGQVNEEQMRNNKKRVDGARENGTKLMKKNQELRGLEMGLSQALNEIQRMEKQINRKENFIKNRPKVSIPFEYLRNIYIQFSQNDKNDINKMQVDNKIGKGQLPEFVNSSNYITSNNVKLKYVINLYEQLETSKKSDSYTNLDNENQCLKGIISSIIRMQFFEPKREKILRSVDEINSNLDDFKLQMSQLRLQKLESKRK